MKNLIDSIKSNVVQLRSDDSKASRLNQRRAIAELKAMSDSQLRDIGITRGSIADSVKNGRAVNRAA